MKNLFKPFCSSANKVLLDYKAFKKYIKETLEAKTDEDKANSIEYHDYLKE